MSWVSNLLRDLEIHSCYNLWDLLILVQQSIENPESKWSLMEDSRCVSSLDSSSWPTTDLLLIEGQSFSSLQTCVYNHQVINHWKGLYVSFSYLHSQAPIIICELFLRSQIMHFPCDGSWEREVPLDQQEDTNRLFVLLVRRYVQKQFPQLTVVCGSSNTSAWIRKRQTKCVPEEKRL